ncbi:ABC transporter permease [Paenibacillus sp. GCM10023252]|uniref:ABC transporter permease n=1 Tax=Paenibacillus sp. GCM10023252 TaxID=3252649 RepID=UPI003609A624
MTAVWGLTWKELLRKKVTLMTVIMTVLFWVIFWFIAQSIHTEQEAREVANLFDLMANIRDSITMIALGFFFGTFAVAFLAIFSAVAAVSGEAENGVLQSVLARPIPRWKWYLGRWLGFVCFGVLYAFVIFTSILLITYLTTGFALEVLTMVKAFLLFASIIPLLVSITMLGSVWLSPLGNGVAMTMLYGMGWLGGMVEKVLRSEAFDEDAVNRMETISGLIAILMPADSLQQRMMVELFNMKELQGIINMDNLGPFSLGTVPSNAFLIYIACYMLTALLLGMVILRRRDF